MVRNQNGCIAWSIRSAVLVSFLLSEEEELMGGGRGQSGGIGWLIIVGLSEGERG